MIQNGKFVYDLYQNEEYAFEQITETTADQVVFLTGSPLEKKCFDSLRETNSWIDNSQNTNNPPDYLNSSRGFMLDFMIVNDYEKTTESGKAINAPAKEGAKMAKEVREANFSGLFPDVSNIMIEYDDNMAPDYKQYYRNFCRVIDCHKKQISKYRKNHPECETLCFGICDISEHEHFLEIKMNGKTEKKPGHPCFDIEFLRKIKQCGADIVLWFSPYISPPHGKTIRLLIIDVEALIPEKYGVHIQL